MSRIRQQSIVWLRINMRAGTAIVVRWPPRSLPLAFHGPLAYGIWRDSDDVEHLHVYAVVGPG